jgi:hypothetical protein
MNQGIAFSRTLRALDVDDFRASKLGLLAAVVLLAAWAWWMFGARVPRYETTNDVNYEYPHAIAYFPLDTARRILPGQQALVDFDGTALSARVGNVTAGRVELVLAKPPFLQLGFSPVFANARIEIARMSPAAIALRTLTRGNR